MPSEVFQEAIELEIEALEAISLEPGTEAFLSSYPYPGLAKTGKKEKAELPVLSMESAYLRVLVAPTLGGRILDILDKRSGTWLFGHTNSLPLNEGGPRGVECPAGIRWSALPQRLNDLGPVDFTVVEPEDEDSPAGVWLSELVVGSPVGIHVGISLAAEEPVIRLEMRTFNRSFGFVHASPRIIFPLPANSDHAASKFGFGVIDLATRGGILIQSESPLQHEIASQVSVGRFLKGADLAPHQLDSWSVRISIHSDMETLTAFGDGVAVWANESRIGISATQPLGEAKLVLRTHDGRTLEAPIEVAPQAPTVLPLEGIGIPNGFAILTRDRKELLRWPQPQTEPLQPVRWDKGGVEAFQSVAKEALAGENKKAELETFASNLGYRAPALALLGVAELREGRFAEAAELFEDALSYNAEDHLTWWMLGAARRHANVSSEEQVEILNAHYLAPLEPLLRAESFLAAPPDRQSPSLLAPLKDDPQALVEVACLLYELRLFRDLSQWARAGLAQAEVPMLRYLLAASLLETGTMRAEAAQEVALAGRSAAKPPYPWRAVEFKVLQRLRAEFPSDERLRAFCTVVQVSS